MCARWRWQSQPLPARRRSIRRVSVVCAAHGSSIRARRSTPTPMPEPVEPVHLLALLTRVRAQRVAAGELAGGRLHDVRAFKCAYAELGYLRRLAAAGRAGGTVVTSMRQLVAGLAALHPAWRISGGRGSRIAIAITARSVGGWMRCRRWACCGGGSGPIWMGRSAAPSSSCARRRSPAPRSCRPPPAAWSAGRRRYGQALNTGSGTGIRNAAGYGRPLSASERQRRGCRQARAAARRRCQARLSIKFGTPLRGFGYAEEQPYDHKGFQRFVALCKEQA